MLTAIFNALSGIGSAIASAFDFLKQKQVIDAIEDKNDAENERDAIKETLETERKENEREADLRAIQKKLDGIKKTKRERKARKIEG